jgi:hypothetical protein
MTDFFADLEQELRGAHPRRSRPVVPVRPVALALAVIAAVVAVASLVPAGEQEAVRQPPAEEGWTGYAPLECDGGRVVDGTIPDEIVDRFAILRGDLEPLDLPDAEVPAGVAEVVRQSLRRVDGPLLNEYVFALARLAVDDCAPGPQVVCLISIQSEIAVCRPAEAGKALLVHLTEPLDDRRRVVALLADDAVRRAEVRTGERGQVVQLGADAPNVGFLTLPADGDAPVRVMDATP